MNDVGGFIWILIALYFLPSIIASIRRHHQSVAIFLTNLLLGWSVLGWIAALIWSATAKRTPVNVIVTSNAPPQSPPSRSA